jgi:hypothetical protein
MDTGRRKLSDPSGEKKGLARFQRQQPILTTMGLIKGRYTGNAFIFPKKNTNVKDQYWLISR